MKSYYITKSKREISNSTETSSARWPVYSIIDSGKCEKSSQAFKKWSLPAGFSVFEMDTQSNVSRSDKNPQQQLPYKTTPKVDSSSKAPTTRLLPSLSLISPRYKFLFNFTPKYFIFLLPPCPTTTHHRPLLHTHAKKKKKNQNLNTPLSRFQKYFHH